MMDGELHVGRDGVDIKGRDSILVGAALSLMLFVGWIFWGHLAKDDQARYEISDKLNRMQADHAKIAQSMENIDKQMELQSYLMVATPEQERYAQKIIKTPRLLQRHQGD